MAKKSSRSKPTTYNFNSVPAVNHIRLINGDEIIGFILGETDTHITVDHPLVVVTVTDDNGTYTALKRYVPFAKEKLIHFQKGHVIATTDLHPEIEKYYFLSLKLNSMDTKLISHIQKANQTMEQTLINSSISRANNLEDKLIHIVPGTESKN